MSFTFSNELVSRMAQTLGSQGAAQELLTAVQTLITAINVPLTGELVIPDTFTLLSPVFVQKSVGAAVAAGSTNADGAAIPFYSNVVSGADGTKGVVLPATPVVGQQVEVINTNLSNALKVYSDPSGTGGTINGGSANAAASLAAGKAAVYRCISITGANKWWSISN